MDRTPYASDDSLSNLAALDFSGYGGRESGADDTYGALALDVYPTYAPEKPEGLGTDLDAIGAVTEDEDDTDLGPLTKVTNPHGTVTVSARVDGSIHQVELAPIVTRMSESQLAEEIVVIAELARRRARANQHAFILETLAESAAGEHDTAKIRAILEESMGLPSPEEADADQAEVFAIRYKPDDDQSD